MRKIALSFASLVAMLALALPARAQPLVTFVSATGTDTNNNCFLAATPCGTMFHALQSSGSGGYITCLTPIGLESAVTIDKSITIDCPTSVGFGVFTINA